MKTTITTYLPGDILFYTADKTQGNLIDSAIANWEASPYVHIAVAISAIQKIEALQHGVILSPINDETIADVWSYTTHAKPLVPENVSSALAWLHSQVGQLYGWIDILDAVLYKLEHGILLIGEHFDCSALACEFLLKAGGVNALSNITNPHKVTPAILANLLLQNRTQ